jgi:two-component system KDP operon response regulator KdpE
VINIGDIELDSERRLVRKSGNLIHLTPKEFDLLRCQMLQPGKPLTHERLLTSVWGTEYGNEFEYLRTFVRQLRKKLEDDPSDPTLRILWLPLQRSELRRFRQRQVYGHRRMV